ncbi:Uncharacterised protein [Bordetella pertussis]|nr:Uncharacterised protein [Bordetella pertussis]
MQAIRQCIGIRQIGNGAHIPCIRDHAIWAGCLENRLLAPIDAVAAQTPYVVFGGIQTAVVRLSVHAAFDAFGERLLVDVGIQIDGAGQFVVGEP